MAAEVKEQDLDRADEQDRAARATGRIVFAIARIGDVIGTAAESARRELIEETLCALAEALSIVECSFEDAS